MKIEFVSCDDWVAMYIDGKKAEDGHSLHYSHVLDALKIEYTSREIEVPSDADIDFADDINEIKVISYGDDES
jgi:hypothetical protein